jgi:NTP pyrophosphatase (non-canonical NTP hydrolase)
MKLEHVVEIDMRLRRASEKHGAFADASHMWGALDLEHREVHEAVQDRDHDALRDELFDLVTVALRYLEATE